MKKSILLKSLVLVSGMVQYIPHFASAYESSSSSSSFDSNEGPDDKKFLVIKINPLIRINFYETPENISAEGVEAFIDVINRHATNIMRSSFRSAYGPNAHNFKKVSFEALEATSLVQNRRDLQEGELVIRENDLKLEHSEFHPNGDLKTRSERDLEQIFGTSFLLGGNFTFKSLPMAPSRECNRKLSNLIDNKLSQLARKIRNMNNAELKPLGDSPQPKLEATPDPTAAPTREPIMIQPKEPARAPSSNEQINNSPSIQIPVADDSPFIDPTANNNNDETFPILIPIVSSMVFVGISALILLKRRRSSNISGQPGMLPHQKRGGDDEFGRVEGDESYGYDSDLGGMSASLTFTHDENSSIDTAHDQHSEVILSSKPSLLPGDNCSIATSETIKASNLPSSGRRRDSNHQREVDEEKRMETCDELCDVPL